MHDGTAAEGDRGTVEHAQTQDRYVSTGTLQTQVCKQCTHMTCTDGTQFSAHTTPKARMYRRHPNGRTQRTQQSQTPTAPNTDHTLKPRCGCTGGTQMGALSAPNSRKHRRHPIQTTKHTQGADGQEALGARNSVQYSMHAYDRTLGTLYGPTMSCMERTWFRCRKGGTYMRQAAFLTWR